LQVVKAQIVVDRPRGPKGQPLKVAECIVGDETGVIIFTARNEQGTVCLTQLAGCQQLERVVTFTLDP
jgi:hypothetical protein